MKLGPFWVGDQPANPIEIDITDAEDDADELAMYTAATVELIGSGSVRTIAGATYIGGVLLFPLPTDPFPAAGVYRLRVTLTGPGVLQLDPIWVVAQDNADGWASLAFARDEEAGGWREAETIGDVTLYRLLDIARDQVLAYAPVLAEGAAIPLSYLAAQLMQARNIWNSQRVAPSGDVGGESFALTPFPLDWQVKQILRPKRAVPVIA